MNEEYLDLTALAVAMKITTGAAPTGAIATELTRLREVGIAVVEARNLLDSCPQAIKDQALILLCGHWFDGPVLQRGMAESALRRSGALGLLRDWTKHGGHVIA